ncbi:hypothetical protein VTL71DRAFT_5101 [Oculimacula yallundae]|uniref:Heterokaryon incompatibility domain-containing protein n=1 Tax=Oculimacula yallundae TaxID=86028 RepID=A0ABR4C061_9HELO
MSLNRESEANTTRLCEKCSLMFSTIESLNALLSDQGYQHWTRAELQLSISNGCDACKNLFTAGCFTTQGLLGAFGLQGRLVQNLESSAYPLDITHIYAIGPLYKEFGPFYRLVTVKALEGTSAAEFIDNGVDNSWQGMYNAAAAMLEDCHMSHKGCPRAEIPLLPRRVIDVGNRECQSVPNLHVSSPGERSRYVTLSYCWGGPQKVVTTLETLSKHIDEMPLEKLPRTIRDAIKVTKQLGINYLWVDSLCIVQDDRVDKEEEIKLMGDTYNSSSLTIVASNSAAVDDGFLNQRRHERTEDFPEHILLPMLLQDGSMCNIAMPKTIKRMFNGGEVGNRGWTMQEYMLSPRLMIFEESEVLWQCSTGDLRGVVPGGSSYTTSLKRLTSVAHAVGKSTSSQEALWRNIVEDYSGRQLTLQSDRLPAISGISTAFSQKWKDEYLCGMWGCLIPAHLGWYLKIPWGNERTNTHPTWSWTSIPSKVKFDVVHVSDVEILNCGVDLLDTNNVFGDVTGGKLTMDAKTVSFINFANEINEACIFRMDSSSTALDTITYILLRLGKTRMGEVICLILSPLKDGNYHRVGQAQCSGGMEPLWASVEMSRFTIV